MRAPAVGTEAHGATCPLDPQQPADVGPRDLHQPERRRGEAGDPGRPARGPRRLETTVPGGGKLGIEKREAVEEDERSHAGFSRVLERELVRTLSQERGRQLDVERGRKLAVEAQLAHEGAVHRSPDVVVHDIFHVRGALQRDGEPRARGEAALHAREREADRLGSPRDERLPQPGVRRVEQPRLVEAVRLEARERPGRGGRRCDGRGLHLRHAHAVRGERERVGDLSRERGRRSGDVGVEDEQAPGPEGGGAGLDVEGDGHAVPGELQRADRDRAPAAREELLEGERLQALPRRRG